MRSIVIVCLRIVLGIVQCTQAIEQILNARWRASLSFVKNVF